jgi:hypothetical protein
MYMVFISIHMCLHTLTHSVSGPYKIIINVCFIILMFLLQPFPNWVLRHFQISLPVSSWRDWNSSVSIVTNLRTGRPANRRVFLAGSEISVYTIATRSTLGKNHPLNTLRTGDADLRLYITTLQDGWCKSAFLTRWNSVHLQVLLSATP